MPFAQQSRFRVMLKSAFRSLLMHKLRSFLTVLGMIFGVASVVVMLAIAEGAERESASEIQSLGVRNIYLKSEKPKKTSGSRTASFSTQVEYGLGMSDVEQISIASPFIENVVAIRRVERDLKSVGKDEPIDLVAVMPSFFDSQPMELIDGRFIVQKDVTNRENVCIISQSLAVKFFGFSQPIGRLINIGSQKNFVKPQSFRVIGVVQDVQVEGGKNVSSKGRQEVYVPLPTDLSRFGKRIMSIGNGSYDVRSIELTDILVQVKDNEHVATTAEFLHNLLKRTHPTEDFSISVPLELLLKARRQQRIFAIVVGSIAAISLLVGGIGIMNIMLATVSERTHEIGIRRALGARRTDIVSQFLFETVTLSMIGATMGLGLGLLVPPLVSDFTEIPTYISISTLIAAVGVAMIVGVVSGIYPAQRAAQLDPVKALQHV